MCNGTHLNKMGVQRGLNRLVRDKNEGQTTESSLATAHFSPRSFSRKEGVYAVLGTSTSQIGASSREKVPKHFEKAMAYDTSKGKLMGANRSRHLTPTVEG